MKIRTGLYTLIKGVEYNFYEARNEVPTELEVILLTDDESIANSEGFMSSNQHEHYWKKISLSKLTNGYWITTKSSYLSIEVEVFPKTDPSKVLIASRNPDEAIKAGLTLTNSNWYTKEIPAELLSDLWEEYTSTQYGLPLPTNLPSKRNLL